MTGLHVQNVVMTMLAASCCIPLKLNRIARFGFFWVCLMMLLCFSGCRTPVTTVPDVSSQSSPQLEETDIRLSQAFAAYSAGLICASEDDGPGALRAFKRASALDPEGRRPLDALILTDLAHEQHDQALDDLDAFCRKHPDDLKAHLDLARLAEWSGNFTRAASHFSTAYHLSPTNVPLAYAWVRNLFFAGEDRQAIAAIKELQRDIHSDDARNLPVYWAFQSLKNAPSSARALPYLSVAIATATDQVIRTECQFFYGDAAARSGDTTSAEEAFERCLSINATHLRAALSLGRLRYRADPDHAITKQRRRINHQSDDPSAWVVLAGIHLAAQDQTNAATALAAADDHFRARGMVPTVAFYLLHGELLDEIRQHQDAAVVFQKGLEVHPRAHAIMNYLAYMLAEDGEHLDLAEKMARKAVELRPHMGAYLDTLGWVLYRQRHFNQALDLLMQARISLPDDPTVLDHVGDVLAALSRTSEAGAYWSRSFAQDPTQESVGKKLKNAGINPDSIPKISVPHQSGPDDDEWNAEDEDDDATP